MACKTIIDDPIQKVWNEHVQTLNINIEEASQLAVNNEFGVPINRTKRYTRKANDYQNRIKEDTIIIKKLKKDKSKSTKAKDRIAIQKRIDKLEFKKENNKIALSKYKQLLKNEPKAFKFRQDIVSLIQGRLKIVAEKTGFVESNFTQFANVLNWYLREYHIGYGTLDNADLGTLTSIHRDLKNIFKKQDKGEGGFDKGFRGKAHATLWDPALAVLRYDKTGAALDIVEKSYDQVTVVSQLQNRYKARVDDSLNDLIFEVSEKGIDYKVGFADADNPSNSELELSKKNSIALVHDILDGRVKYIKPKKINLSKIDMKDPKSFINTIGQETFKSIVNIIDYAIDSNIQKDIQNIPGTDLYYVLIMERNKATGKEVNVPYFVPAKIGDNGRPSFTYPKTKNKKKVSSLWAKEFIKLNNENNISELVPEGMYESRQQKLYEGENKRGDEIYVKGYQDYTKVDSLNSKHSEVIYNSVSDIRLVAEELFDYATEAVAKNEEILQQFMEALSIGYKNSGMNQQQIEEAISNLFNALGVEWNVWTDKDGNVHTENGKLSKRELYAPEQYTTEALIEMIGDGVAALSTKLSNAENRINYLQGKINESDDILEQNNYRSEIIKLNKRIERYKEAIAGLLDRKDLIIGKKEIGELQYSLQKKLIFSDHRELWTDNTKRRKDAKVFTEWVDRYIKTTEANNLLVELVKSLAVVDPQLHEYLINQVKSAVGRRDVKASFMGLDYSDEKIKAGLEKIGIGEHWFKKLQNTINNTSSLQSGGMLGIGTSISNNFQDVSKYIWNGLYKPAQRRKELQNRKNWKERKSLIISEAGTTDIVVAIADAFFSHSNGEVNALDGIRGWKDLGIFKLSKSEFLRKASVSGSWLNTWLLNLAGRIDNPNISADAKTLAKIRENIYDFINGTAKGTMTVEEANILATKLEGIVTRDLVLGIAKWGLSGMGIIPEGLEGYTTITGSEKRMREAATIDAVIIAEQNEIIPPDIWEMSEDEMLEVYGITDPYLHPDALRFARFYIAQTMFYFSLQHLAPFMRGVFGHYAWKFKPYAWKEFTTEYMYTRAYIDQLIELPKGHGFNQIIHLFNPTDKPVLDRGDKKFQPTARFQKFIFTRVLASAFITFKYWFPPFYVLNKMLNSISLNQFGIIGFTNKAGRGASSVGANVLFQGVMLLLWAAGILSPSDEEQERGIEDWKRGMMYMFTPLMLSVMWQCISEGSVNPLVRTYGRMFGWAIDEIGEALNLDTLKAAEY